MSDGKPEEVSLPLDFVSDDLVEDDQEQRHITRFFTVASFWRRMLAALVDVLIITIICAGLIAVLGNAAYRIGWWGRLVGFSIGTIYLGFLNSEFSKGQTFGKSLMGIKVVDGNRHLLPLGKSMFRGALLSFFVVGFQMVPVLTRTSEMVFFNYRVEWSLRTILPVPVLGSILWAVAGCGLLLTLYGFLFNHATRQGPHDLLMATYVIPVEPHYGNQAPVGRSLHQNLALGCLGLSAVMGAVLGIGLLLFQAIFLSRLSLQTDATPISALLADDRIFDAQIFFERHLPDGSDAVVAKVTAWTTPRCHPVAERCQRLVQDLFQFVSGNLEAGSVAGIEVNVISQAQFGWVVFGQQETRFYQMDDVQ